MGEKIFLMNVCVAPCCVVCVHVCVCLADSFTQSSDIPPDSSELFSARTVKEQEGEKEREREMR